MNDVSGSGSKPRRPTSGTLEDLYAVARHLSKEARLELGLLVPFSTYLQDPLVAESKPGYGIVDTHVAWEPGITDGPTSSRFAVVDYNGDSGVLFETAKWDPKDMCFRDPNDIEVSGENPDTPQFHQVNVWAVLQEALAFFEDSYALGRPVPFGFEGNRLIVVPHAGHGRNAFYDRASKSLQFYYFDTEDEKGNRRRVNTCLSADIVRHEFGHAVLDGIRPLLHEGVRLETSAFHEYVGDLTAILCALRNNDFRDQLAASTQGRLSKADSLKGIAEEFGEAVRDKPYLRSAQNDKTMADVAHEATPHPISEVLTGAVFDFLVEIGSRYQERSNSTAKQALWYACQRIQRMAVQPLDFLPPMDVTFRDYALAMLTAEKLSNPTDPRGYLPLLRDMFARRGILDADDDSLLEAPCCPDDGPRWNVFHGADSISRSRAAAYRFLDDNRDKLLIPLHQDVVVADLYDANKRDRTSARLPRQIVLCYVWYEDVVPDGEEFGNFDGKVVRMPCGGTLVFDEHDRVLSWVRKPGTEGGTGTRWDAEKEEGAQRKATFLRGLAERISSGKVGAALGSSEGLLGTQVPPLTVREEDGSLRFELSPFLGLSDDDGYEGDQRW